MILTILENGPIAKDVWRMRLTRPAGEKGLPGRFLHIRVPGKYLRRPISIAWTGEDSWDIVYKTVGEGTRRMTALPKGARVDALGPLGNGFDPAKAGGAPLLLGGGVGVPPLLDLCRALLEKGVRPQAAFGFNTAADAILLADFRALGIEPLIATMDGSLGIRGFVTDAAKALSFDSFFACGPEPMLRSALRSFPQSGYLSLETRMACGIGACLGCTIETNEGPKRVCKDGPVFAREELRWSI